MCFFAGASDTAFRDAALRRARTENLSVEQSPWLDPAGAPVRSQRRDRGNRHHIKKSPERVRLRGHQLTTLVEETGRLGGFHQFGFDFRVGVGCFAVTRIALRFRPGQ
jgi:hypothetical protein